MDLTPTLSEHGYAEFPDLFRPEPARALFDAAMATRRFDRSLFLSEQEWEDSPKSHRHVNPGPGFNALEKLPPELMDFIDKSDAFHALMAPLLGEDFRIISKRLICRLPWSSVPPWFYARRYGKANNALGAFVHPPHRDISYYLDVDMHQDIHDYLRFPADNRTPDYVTFYVYLDEVSAADAPIQLLGGSHRFGATHFQHPLKHLPSGEWLYEDNGRSMQCPLVTLTGPAGYAAMWHACTLHGTPPVHEGHFRLSLRYLVARGSASHCGLDEVNKDVDGPLFLSTDYTPGANAQADGFWNLQMNDYLRYSYRDLPPA